MIYWYAVRTEPAAQRPHRLAEGQSTIEVALTLAKFAHYMPVQNRVFVHRRTKKMTSTRAPLLPGYIFVADVIEWRPLYDCPGVAGVLGIDGTPAAIPIHQIENLRKVEQSINDMEARRAERRLMKRRIRRKWGHFRAQLTILKMANNVRRESPEGVLSGQDPAGP